MAAAALFSHYGPRKTTVAEIAARAGIATGAVYLHFPSKDALLRTLSGSLHANVIAALKEAAARAQSADDALRRVFDARLEAFLAYAKEGAHQCELVHCSESAVKEAWARYRTAEADLVRHIVKRGLVEGSFAGEPRRAGELSRAVLMAYARFVPPALYTDPPPDPRRALRTLHGLVLDGLRARAPERGAPRQAR